jgi:hypothetical protein
MAKKTATNKTEKNLGGRPRKEIDKKDFEALLRIQCTLKEITSFFDAKLDGCSEDTIERWCQRTYGQSFADVSAQKREYGKISIRRAQFDMMEKNPTMLIWCSKQYLGQTDEVKVENSNNELLNALADLARKKMGET